MNVETANRLVEFRKKNGYSQEDLADKIGVSRQAVSKWERAESSPDTDNLIALAGLYGVSLDELLYAKKEEEAPSKETTGNEPINSGNNHDNDDANNRKFEDSNNDNSKHRSELAAFPYPIAAVIIFFLIGYISGHWEYAWLIFLTIPLYAGIVRAVRKRE